MLAYISKKAANSCAKYMELTEIERLKMVFGFENLLHQLISCSVIIIMATGLHQLTETLIFWGFFGVLRVTAGGFHVKTSLGCTVMTAAIMVGGTRLTLSIRFSIGIVALVFLAICMTMVINAPRRTSNYPVNDEERGRLKRRALCIAVLYGFLAVLFPHGFREITTLAAAAEALTLIPKPYQAQ